MCSWRSERLRPFRGAVEGTCNFKTGSVLAVEVQTAVVEAELHVKTDDAKAKAVAKIAANKIAKAAPAEENVNVVSFPPKVRSIVTKHVFPNCCHDPVHNICYTVEGEKCFGGKHMAFRIGSSGRR